MAQQRIRRHAGGGTELAHLHQNRQHLYLKGHLRPERPLHHEATLMEMNVMKLNVWHPGMGMYILHFQILNDSIIIHMAMIAIVIKMVFQICWVHYLLRRNTADIDFDDDSSWLSESEGEDEHWLKGMEFMSIIIIYN